MGSPCRTGSVQKVIGIEHHVSSRGRIACRSRPAFHPSMPLGLSGGLHCPQRDTAIPRYPRTLPAKVGRLPLVPPEVAPDLPGLSTRAVSQPVQRRSIRRRAASPPRLSARGVRATAFALVRPKRPAEYRSHASRHPGVAAHQTCNGRDYTPSDSLLVAPENAPSDIAEVAPGVLSCHQPGRRAARSATIQSQAACQ